MNGEMQTAHDLVERALYSLEMHFHPAFKPGAGCTLDYGHYENRCLFLALFRHVFFLSQRGCWRTAQECCTYLLSLAPDADPLCAIFLLDNLCLRSGDYDFLERVFNEWRVGHGLEWLPNMMLSVALLRYLRHREDPAAHSRRAADDMLVDALTHFPEFINMLCDRIDARMKPEIAAHAVFAVPPSVSGSAKNVRLLVCLYIERTHALWKSTDVLEWLQVCVVCC